MLQIIFRPYWLHCVTGLYRSAGWFPLVKVTQFAVWAPRLWNTLHLNLAYLYYSNLKSKWWCICCVANLAWFYYPHFLCVVFPLVLHFVVYIVLCCNVSCDAGCKSLKLSYRIFMLVRQNEDSDNFRMNVIILFSAKCLIVYTFWSIGKKNNCNFYRNCLLMWSKTYVSWVHQWRQQRAEMSRWKQSEWEIPVGFTVTSVEVFANTGHLCPDNTGLSHPASYSCENKWGSITKSVF